MSERILRLSRGTLALLFAAATLLYMGLWLVAVRYQPGVELGYDSDYLADEQAQRITRVLPGSPAERIGLEAGDWLVAIDGAPLADVGYQARAWVRHQPGDTVSITVRRGGREAPEVRTATFRRRIPRTTGTGALGTAASGILNVYPLPFVIVGLAVLLLRIDDRRAWMLAVVLMGFASTPAFPESLSLFAPGAMPFTRWYQGLLIGFFGPVFFWFFATFPSESPLARRVPWLKWFVLATGVPVAMAGVRTGAVRLPEPFPTWLGEARSTQAAVLWLLCVLALGVCALISQFFATTDVQARRRLRVIVFGTAVALIPNLVIVAATSLTQRREPEGLAALRAAFAFVLPLSVAYAVVKHRVLEIPVLLRLGARYLLVQRGFTILLALASVAAAFGLSAWLADAVATFGARAQSAGITLGIGLGTVLLWGGSGLHRRVSTRIDRAFFRQAYDARAILQDLADRASRVQDRGELAGLLWRHVRDAMHPDALAVYLRAADGQLARMAGAWEETSAAPEHAVHADGRDGQPSVRIELGVRRSEEPYTREDGALLAVVARQAALALDNLELAEQMAQRLEAERRHEYELNIAKDVQQMLLPQRALPTASVDCAGTCSQARVVGGDYFDYLDLGPGRLGLVIADISGKGMAAALLMANLQAIVRSQVSRVATGLGDVLGQVNAHVFASTAANRFATMVVVDMDDRTGRMQYVNCGHNPPLIVGADGQAEWLAPTAVALGFFAEWSCTVGVRQLRPGDVLVLYSDGITEAWSEAGEEYGDARLVDVVRAHRHRPAAELLARVMDDVTGFAAQARSDDWTLVVARIRDDRPLMES